MALQNNFPGPFATSPGRICGRSASVGVSNTNSLSLSKELSYALTFEDFGLGTAASLGKFHLMRKIGEGGFGVVYQALLEQEDGTQCYVALKFAKLNKVRTCSSDRCDRYSIYFQLGFDPCFLF